MPFWTIAPLARSCLCLRCNNQDQLHFNAEGAFDNDAAVSTLHGTVPGCRMVLVWSTSWCTGARLGKWPWRIFWKGISLLKELTLEGTRLHSDSLTLLFMFLSRKEFSTCRLPLLMKPHSSWEMRDYTIPDGYMVWRIVPRTFLQICSLFHPIATLLGIISVISCSK